MRRILLILWLLAVPLAAAPPHTSFENLSLGVHYKCPANCLLIDEPKKLGRGGPAGPKFLVFLRSPAGKPTSATFSLIVEDLPTRAASNAGFAKLSQEMTSQVVPAYRPMQPPLPRLIGGRAFEGYEYGGMSQDHLCHFRCYTSVDVSRNLAFTILMTDGASAYRTSFPALEAALGGFRWDPDATKTDPLLSFVSELSESSALARVLMLSSPGFS